MSNVFISYAREDHWHAQKLYMDLRVADIDCWIDTKCLLPGMNWDNTIQNVIRNCKYFIFFISEHSNLNKRYLMRELELALEVQATLPVDRVFIIPIRLVNVAPSKSELEKYNYIDFFSSYDKGLGRILTVLEDAAKDPLVIRGGNVNVGRRAAIDFEPFEDVGGFIRDVLRSYPISSAFINPQHGLYFTFYTRHEQVIMPDYLREKYPDKMTLVLQYSYDAFMLYHHHLTIELLFDGKTEDLTIPYDSIFQLVSTMGFRIVRVDEKTVA
ncbi:ClpXP protease specificity-enhancing factor SspB [Dyadobacter fanqingshengii]|uniref:ClpXP protease specificity-enhancing factor SspB n=1 Tax=Dyadobacter fanqingshengii TaxID=2906443 RepID=A0A9X1T8K3_9BACT|nr:ClpXP protease specificity-enhancing factor SspB [Dyadobacter fanqingshengii]MCF0039741.1 ClpXP protease specificity-enhancing factor SspB [Dyadobacter fanqingshengii]USJ38497.1 ClpXP protease specificity-enhancing factor SspB [Dyadobacter fanqingshengii]